MTENGSAVGATDPGGSAETTKPTGAVTLSFASYLAQDIEALSAFYASVFDLAEVEELRSDIFRGLQVGEVVVGFSAHAAYELLSIEPWADARGTCQYLTFEVESDALVTAKTELAIEHGAELRHEPYETYYGTFQSVLADPEGNIFRINHSR